MESNPPHRATTRTVSNLRIRRGKTEDWKSIFQIQKSPEFVRYTGYSSPPSEQRVREKWEKRLSEPLFHTLVAETDDSKEVVGYVRLKQGDGKASHVGEVSILAVRADWQRKGIGMQLMRAILDLADNSLALKRLRLTLHADNEAAIRLYERLGFGMEGRERKAAHKDGIYIDILIMGRVRD